MYKEGGLEFPISSSYRKFESYVISAVLDLGHLPLSVQSRSKFMILCPFFLMDAISPKD